MAWDDISAGESGGSARSKINNLGLDFDNSQLANVVVINSEANFPTQDATTITLEDDVAYIIGAPITTSKRFIGNTATLSSFLSSSTPLITYTGTGSMFTVTNERFSMRLMTFSCPGATFMEVVSDNTFNLNHRVNMAECIVFDCVTAFKSVTGGGMIAETCQFVNVSGTEAFDVDSGNVGIFSLDRVGMFGLVSGASAVNLHPTLAKLLIFEMTNVAAFGDAGAHYISGGSSSVNLLPGTLGTVNDGNAFGFTVPLVGLSEDDGEWIFRDNEGIPDSYVCANPYLDTATAVTIVATNTFVKVNGGNWLFTEDCKLSVSTDGDIENTGSRTIKVQVSGFATMDIAGGSTDELLARIVLNDDPDLLASVITENSTENGQPTSASLLGLFTLNPGDTLSTWVANADSTANINVTRAVLTLLALA